VGDWSALNRLGPVAVAAIHLRADLRCTYCAADLTKTPLRFRQTDHVIPRRDGGTDEPANLVLACHKCNVGRGTGDGLLPLRAALRGRTEAQVRAEIRRQTSIPIGPGSEIHAAAIERAWQWWPDQLLRRTRARRAWCERQCFEYFEAAGGLAA
jgi:hypothetical protein